MSNGETAMTEPIKLPNVAFCKVSDVSIVGGHEVQLGVSADTKLYTADQARAAIEADRQARGVAVNKPSDETIRLVSIIANKIEDGALFNAGIFSRKELAEKVREVLIFAAQTAPQPQQIPEGYKMVPVEPPTNCRQRLAKEGKPYPRSSCFVCGKLSPRHRECDAMLEAAPEPKEKS